MLKKAKAFIALIASVTIVKCDIAIHRTSDHLQIDKDFKDYPSNFGTDIPSDSIKVF